MGTLMVFMLWIGCNIGIDLWMRKKRREKRRRSRASKRTVSCVKYSRHTAGKDEDFTDWRLSA